MSGLGRRYTNRIYRPAYRQKDEGCRDRQGERTWKKVDGGWILGYLWEYIYYKIFEISSLTDYEYAQIVGQFNQVNGSGDFEKKLKDRGYTDAAIAEYKKRNNNSMIINSLNLKFTTSDKMEYNLFDYTYTLFDAYERKGLTPFNGPVSEQPAKIMEIFSVYRALENEYEKRAMEEHRREQKKVKR